MPMSVERPSRRRSGRRVMTLLIVPAGFSLADGLEKRVGPWLRKRVLTLEHGHEDPGHMAPQPAE